MPNTRISAVISSALIPLAILLAQSVINLRPVVATQPVGEDPDDPAIWVHPTDPAKSLILGTDKTAAPKGALFVFGLDGKFRQKVPELDRPNNVDVEYGLMLAGKRTDIAVLTERYQKRLRVFGIAPDGSGVSDVSSGGGLPVFQGQTGEQAAPMGIALYRRPRDGAIFAIVGRKTGLREGYLWQYLLEDDGAGKVKGTKVREFGRFSGQGEIEAIAVDDDLGYVYYADEGDGIHKWHADPDHPAAGRELAHFGRDGFKADREGIAVYARPDGTGYVVCTDQLPGNSEYRVYRREGKPGQPHDHSELIKIIRGGADSTDGIEVTSEALGPRFPKGLLVVMNSNGRNFLLYQFPDVGTMAAPDLVATAPIRLHPDNPHYFLFRGKPTILVTSGEHYGAVLNLDFDYARYFRALEKDRLNLTRAFTGAYREIPGSFRITNNTLAPKPDRFICPWPRSAEPGATDGLNKFDLSKWNDAYFARLRDFVREAGRRGVIVELSLFCPYYEDSMWEVSALNAKNNINGIGDVKRTDVVTLKDDKLVALQDAMVRKIVTELRDFDNLYYEICNEPYFGGVTLDWQAHIAATIVETEASFPARHLIAQNIANGSVKIEKPNPTVSLFNFHYSRPPDSVALNYALNKAIGNNETGFDGTSDAPYRIQGWDFLIAGGALYNNLDYSFAAGHEDGTFVLPATQPGGGSPALRRQLRILRDFLYEMDFTRMAPASSVIKAGVSEGASARALAEPGKTYAVYIHHGRQVKDAKPRYQVDSAPRQIRLTLELPAGSYRASWLNTRTGRIDKRESFSHAGGERVLVSPSYTEDIALRVSRTR